MIYGFPMSPFYKRKLLENTHVQDRADLHVMHDARGLLDAAEDVVVTGTIRGVIGAAISIRR